MKEAVVPPWLADMCDHLADLPGVVAVALGGSRALRIDDALSDWDLGLYYRGHLDWRPIERFGVVYQPGTWGRVMNGGAWLSVADAKLDVLFRNLDFVEMCTEWALVGDYDVDALLGYVAGVPTYSLMAEAATCVVLRGSLARPDSFPERLFERAPPRWRVRRDFSLGYARMLARRGDVVPAVGQVAKAVLEEAHARVCEQRKWVLNEKRLVSQAELSSASAWIVRPPKDFTAFEDWLAEGEELLRR